MPCLDTLDSRSTYDFTITLTGADEEGVLPGGLKVDVLGCGDFVRSEAIDAPRHPARRDREQQQQQQQRQEGHAMQVEGAGSSSSSSSRGVKRGRAFSIGGGEEVVEALLGPSGHMRKRTRCWVFRIPIPVPPSALGWVVGPLATVSRKVVCVGAGGQEVREDGSGSGGGGGAGCSIGGATPGARGFGGGRTPAPGMGYHTGLVPGGGGGGGASTNGPFFPQTASHFARGAGSSTDRSGGQYTQSVVWGGAGSALGGGGSHSTRVSYHAPPAAVASGAAATHIHRTRRMVLWFCDYLACAYPFNAHRFAFLPLGASAALGAASASSTAPIAVCAGLTILPDSVLHSCRYVDSEAATHELMAECLASVWLGVLVSPASWRDAWLFRGLCGYVTAAYMASFRGEGEGELARARAAERVESMEGSSGEVGGAGAAALAGGGARMPQPQCLPWAVYPLCPPMVLPSTPAPAPPPPAFPCHLPMLLSSAREAHVGAKAPLAIHALAQCVGENRFRMGVGALVGKVLSGDAVVGGSSGTGDAGGGRGCWRQQQRCCKPWQGCAGSAKALLGRFLPLRVHGAVLGTLGAPGCCLGRQRQYQCHQRQRQRSSG